MPGTTAIGYVLPVSAEAMIVSDWGWICEGEGEGMRGDPGSRGQLEHARACATRARLPALGRRTHVERGEVPAKGDKVVLGDLVVGLACGPSRILKGVGTGNPSVSVRKSRSTRRRRARRRCTGVRALRWNER